MYNAPTYDVYERACEIFDCELFFPLNTFIMRRSVLEDFCGWIFPRLFDIMDTVGTCENTYQNRYPAFIAERLLTLFFEMNRDRYRIVYADKGFLQ